MDTPKDGSKNGRKTKILVVDDERTIADTIVAILVRHGFDATPAYSGGEAIEVAARICPDRMLSDVMMPDVNGIELAKLVHRICPTTKILLFSGQASTADLLQEARADGLDFELLAKPIHPNLLVEKLS